MTRSLRRRIWESVAAMGFARAVQTGYVFILVPILLSQWGVEVYGEWLILSAIASFGALANFGMFQAAAVEVSLAAGAGDREQASRINATALVMGSVFVVVVLSIVWLLLQFVDPRNLFGVHTIVAGDALAVTLLSLASVVLTVLIPTFSAALNVTVGGALSTVTAALVRVVELVAIAVAVYTGGGPVSVAAILVGSVCLNGIAHAALARHWVPWLSCRPSLFDVAILRRLIRPSLAQFLYYVSANILVVQMPRIILGHLAGPAAVAAFGVTVTYARAGRTLATLFSFSLHVETTRAYAEKRVDVFIRLTEALCQVHLWGSLAVLAGMVVFGPWVFSVWTHGKIGFDPWLCLVLGIGFVIGAYCDAVITVLLGINRMSAAAVAHFAAAVVAMGLGYYAVTAFGAIGMAAVLILPDSVAAVAGILVFCELVSFPRRTFVVKSVQWPVELVRKEADRVLQFWARR